MKTNSSNYHYGRVKAVYSFPVHGHNKNGNGDRWVYNFVNGKLDIGDDRVENYYNNFIYTEIQATNNNIKSRIIHVYTKLHSKVNPRMWDLRSTVPFCYGCASLSGLFGVPFSSFNGHFYSPNKNVSLEKCNNSNLVVFPNGNNYGVGRRTREVVQNLYLLLKEDLSISDLN